MNKKIKNILLISFAATFIFSTNVNAATGVTYKDQITALNTLKIADESRTGYVRTKFKHWVSAGNGCDSRKAVIISEAIVKPKIETGCKIVGGEWLSIYDNIKITDASKLDVDHMVPLAEAWDSGASAWDDAKREMYANDQTDPRHLIAVTGASNRSKSDRDPSEWVPSNTSYICEYLTNWVSIKVRWNLSIDKLEKATLETNLKSCKKTKIVVIPVK